VISVLSRKQTESQPAEFTQLFSDQPLRTCCKETEDIEADLEACLLRGWVKILDAGMPSGSTQPLLEHGDLILDTKEDVYRLTDAGWAVINRDRQVELIGVTLAVIGLLLSL
jgi:hypothetical protein